jgi:hypothetical protein
MSVTIFKYHILFVVLLLFSITGLNAQRRTFRTVVQDSSTVSTDSLNIVKDSVESPNQKVLASLNPALQNQYRIVTVNGEGLRIHNIYNFDVQQYFQSKLRSSNLDRQYGTLKAHRENWILFTVLALIFGVGMIRVFFLLILNWFFRGTGMIGSYCL